MTKPLLQISKAGATTSSNDIVPKFSIAVSHESQAAGVTALSIVEGTPSFELDLKYSIDANSGHFPTPLIVDISLDSDE